LTTNPSFSSFSAAVLCGLVLLCSCGPPRTEDTIATYDGGAITRPELELYLESLDKRRLRTDASLSAEEGMRELLREYAATRILADEVDQPEPDEESALYVTPKARFLVQYYRERIGKRSHSVSDEEARSFYEQHLETRFTLPDSIRFQHVFLRGDLHDAAELRDLEARILAEHEGGVGFTQLVARYSESGSKEHQGIVGPVFRGRLEESFEEQLFELELGDPPAVIRTATGSHVVLVLARNAPEPRPFEEVKGQIINGIINRRDEADRAEHFKTLRTRYLVEDHSDDEGLEPDAVALRIHDRSLNRSQLDEFFAQGASFGGAFEHADPRVRRRMINDLVEFNLMYLDAAEQELDREPNFVDRWERALRSQRARVALQRRLARWTEALDEERVLAYYREHETRFVTPERVETSYIFMPFGGRPPFELQQRVEELARLAQREGFDSPELRDACVEQGAFCVASIPMSPKQAARIDPEFQRSFLAMDEPGFSEPIKAQNGIFLIAVHAIEERRPMEAPADMQLIRARYVSLERAEIVASIKRRLLEEHDFRIIGSLDPLPETAQGE
jgi:parvulin-like peptidyl-prolyl isomerase